MFEKVALQLCLFGDLPFNCTRLIRNHGLLSAE
jgi:hypothetical protein